MNKIKNFYFFDDTIDRVFVILRDFKKTDSLMEDIRSTTEITKGVCTYEIGNKFYFYCNKHRYDYEVIDYFEDDRVKTIKWEISIESLDIIFQLEYNLNRVTVGDELILEVIIVNNPLKEFPSDILTSINETISRIKNLLQNDLSDYFVSEAIVLKANRSLVLSLIFNLNQIKHCKETFGKVNYIGDPKKVNSKITFEFTSLGIEVKYLIESIEISEDDLEWKYVIKAKSTSHYVKNIIFTIIKISEDKTFLEIKETFNNIISKERFNGIANEFKDFLINIQETLSSNSLKN